ncbi:MAG: hypothetical protein ACLUPX_07790 [Atopobiaceae bacterium]
MGWQIDESARYAEELRRAEEWMNREYGDEPREAEEDDDGRG